MFIGEEMKLSIKPGKTFRYKKVWQVTEKRDGCIFKCEETDFSIKVEDEYSLPENYIASPFNYSERAIEIDLKSIGFFTS